MLCAGPSGVGLSGPFQLQTGSEWRGRPTVHLIQENVHDGSKLLAHGFGRGDSRLILPDGIRKTWPQILGERVTRGKLGMPNGCTYKGTPWQNTFISVESSGCRTHAIAVETKAKEIPRQ